MRYIVVDLEATCWTAPRNSDMMEIIEIGAVCLIGSAGPAVGEFAEFVRPAESPILSEFCIELTTITQNMTDVADPFTLVFPRFVDWIGKEPFRLVSWGGYDLTQFKKDCVRHKIPLPASFENHINLKQEFSRVKKLKPMGMKAALEILGIPLSGTHHRGIDDARNTSMIAQIILPLLKP